MNLKIQGGGSGDYSNTGSSIGVTTYLEHEDIERHKNGQELEQFFTNDKSYVSAKEVTYKIDHNKRKVGKNHSKFFVITVSPSKDEILQMGKSEKEQTKNFKDYIKNGVMNRYAEGFKQNNFTNKNLLYYAKVHHARNEKAENQMHAHIIVSYKDILDKSKLSPMGINKTHFDREDFVRRCEHTFDKVFNYQRDFKQSFDYLNTMKNGTLQDVRNLYEMRLKHEQRQEQNLDLHNQIKQEQKQELKQEPNPKTYNMGITR